MSETTSNTPPPLPGANDVASRTQVLLARLRPLARQGWWNLKVWVPFLLNPAERIRQVTYHSRENREGFHWTIQLPNHCWKCDQQEGLWRREIEIDLRGFEHAITIVAGAVGCFVFFFFFAAVFRSSVMLLFALLSLAGAAGVFYAKSWLETVTVHISTCPEHAPELPMPDMVTHENELHVFMPTERLAAAARAQLRAERQGRDRSLPGAPRTAESELAHDDAPRGYRSPHGSAPPRTVDLPPIKLADDEDV